jgi:hypothetical protein
MGNFSEVSVERAIKVKPADNYKKYYFSGAIII